MTLSSCAFLLQICYVREWADNSVIHIFVSYLNGWWRHIRALDLPGQYGVTTRSPRDEGWGVRAAGVVDPAGGLWRFHEGSSSPSSTC